MKPNLFIASSLEGLDIAYAIQEELEHTTETTIWSQGVFTPSAGTLEALMSSLNLFDYGVFVFSPDDTAIIRNQEVNTVRDNVLFEFGLFVGKLGKERCFFILPRGMESVHLPTDILGLTPLTFDNNRVDGNLRAALGPSCNKIRNVVLQRGKVKRAEVKEENNTDRPAPKQVENTGEKRMVLRALSQLYQDLDSIVKLSPTSGCGFELRSIYNAAVENAKRLYGDNLIIAQLSLQLASLNFREIYILVGQLKSLLETEETNPIDLPHT